MAYMGYEKPFRALTRTGMHLMHVYGVNTSVNSHTVYLVNYKFMPLEESFFLAEDELLLFEDELV